MFARFIWAANSIPLLQEQKMTNIWFDFFSYFSEFTKQKTHTMFNQLIDSS